MNNANQVATSSQGTNNSQRNVVIAIIVLIISIGLILAYCFSSNKTNSENTVCIVDSITSSADSVECEIDTREQYYGDGATFDVRGHVKSIDGNEYFDTEGRYKPSADCVDVKRNSKGQIIEIDPNDPGQHPHFKYNADGTVAQITDDDCSEPHGLSINTYEPLYRTFKYDSEGFVCAETIKVKFTEDSYEGFSITNAKTVTFTLQYTVIAKDSHGNWTKRRIQGEGVELNFDDGFELAGNSDSWNEEDTEPTEACVYYAKKKIDYVEERMITYYGENSSTSSSRPSSHSNSSSSSTSSSISSSPKEYPSWIIDKWHISTPQGFYSFDIRSDKTSIVKCGDSSESGTWNYIKDSPYSKVVLSQGYTLLVDEKKEIIATDRGYGLYSSNNPSRNQYANPVKQSVCSRCNGSGQMRQYAGNQVIGSTTCPACGGSGSLYR